MNTEYTFRKSALEKAQRWELSDHGIVIRQEGANDVQIPYGRVQSIRLRYLANNRYRTNNYCCSITVGQTTMDIYSSSYESIGSFSNEAATYVPFVKELVQRIMDANPQCKLYTGQTPFVYYGNAIFTVAMVVGFFLVFTYLPVSMGFGIFIKLLLIGYLGIFVIKSFRVNKPGQLTSSEIPATILPEIPTSTTEQ